MPNVDTTVPDRYTGTMVQETKVTARDIEALSEQIRSETAKLASAYLEKFAGDPEGEMRAWLHIAARREAMVTSVYREAERGYRLPEPHVPASDVAWEALTLIWQHEAVHTRFIEVNLTDGMFKGRALTADLMIWLGATEGRFLTTLTGRPRLAQVLSRLAVYIGTMLSPEAVPDLALVLRQLDPREFFLLCATLETTARLAYTRMETLADELADRRAHDGPRSLQLENLARELRLTTLDETFHEHAFEEVAGWVVDGHLDPGLTARDCAQRLAALLPRGGRATSGSEPGPVLTDGGLRTLFERHGVQVTLA